VHAEGRGDVGRIVGAVNAQDLGPVGIDFFGQDHRQSGLHALPEFEPVDRDRGRAVAIDAHEGRWLLKRLQACGPGGRRTRVFLRKRGHRKDAEREDGHSRAFSSSARVNAVVASFMQPTAVNQRTPNAS
jgi:hypothetical protein